MSAAGGPAVDFEVEDIRAAGEAQVVAGMFYDRRVFLVVNTGASRPTVIAFMPHQAEAIGRDLMERPAAGEVHRDRLEPRVVPVPIPREHLGSPDRTVQIGPAVRLVDSDEGLAHPEDEGT